MIKYNLILSILFSLNVSLGMADTIVLDDYAYLHKLTNSLSGTNPSPEMYKSLQTAIENGKQDEFFDSVIIKLTETAFYQTKLVYKFHELLMINASNRLPMNLPSRAKYVYESDDNTNSYEINEMIRADENNALNSLVKTIVKENRPWSELLTSRSYTVHRVKSGKGITESGSDYGFYGAVASQFLPKELSGIVRISPNSTDTNASSSDGLKTVEKMSLSFEDDDPRIAGIITTEPFFRRYTNSSINKNRKRAAAIFRVFLCDPMTAAIPEAKDGDMEAFNLLLPDGLSKEEEELVSELKDAEKLHGTRADCMKCHQKLDPMGKTLLSSGRFLSPFATKGALAFTGYDKRKVNIPVAGIGELADRLVEQPEFARCQVQNFWKWYIGKDMELSETRLSELSETFQNMNFKVNDFVSFLVKSDEFKTRLKPKSEFQQKITHIKSVFKTCVSCHNSSAFIPMADFTKWPIGGNLDSHSEWIKSISKELDLEKFGHQTWKPTMPPKWSSWRPTEKDIELINWWIKEGTPNEKNEKLFNH